MELVGWEDGEDLSGIRGGKNMIRIYAIKIIFHKEQKKERKVVFKIKFSLLRLLINRFNNK